MYAFSYENEAQRAIEFAVPARAARRVASELTLVCGIDFRDILYRGDVAISPISAILFDMFFENIVCICMCGKALIFRCCTSIFFDNKQPADYRFFFSNTVNSQVFLCGSAELRGFYEKRNMKYQKRYGLSLFTMIE